MPIKKPRKIFRGKSKIFIQNIINFLSEKPPDAKRTAAAAAAAVRLASGGFFFFRRFQTALIFSSQCNNIMKSPDSEVHVTHFFQKSRKKFLGEDTLVIARAISAGNHSV